LGATPVKGRKVLLGLLSLALVGALGTLSLHWKERDLGTITILEDGVELLSKPTPPRNIETPNPVLALLKKGESLVVTDKIYGKDYLMYKVSFEGKIGYVEYDIRRLKSGE
jgi:hypothetical protein